MPTDIAASVGGKAIRGVRVRRSISGFAVIRFSSVGEGRLPDAVRLITEEKVKLFFLLYLVPGTAFGGRFQVVAELHQRYAFQAIAGHV
jgi:hypothetical protein